MYVARRLRGEHHMIVQAKLHIENIPERFSLSLAYPLYAWLLSQVSAEDGNRLHEQGTRPVNQYLWLDTETREGWWTVNLLNNEAIELFAPVLEEKKEVRLHLCKFSFDSCEFERIEAPHVFVKRAQGLTLDWRFSIELLTPASFKQNGRYVIFPQESLILQSLIVRWGLCFPDMPLDDADAFAAMLTRAAHCGLPVADATISDEADQNPMLCGTFRSGSAPAGTFDGGV